MASQIEHFAREYVRIFNESGGSSTDDPVVDAAIKLVNAVAEAENVNDGGASDVYRTAADDFYGRDGEIEIDDDAIVSIGEDGAYVAAWVFVEASRVDDDDDRNTIAAETETEL